MVARLAWGWFRIGSRLIWGWFQGLLIGRGRSAKYRGCQVGARGSWSRISGVVGTAAPAAEQQHGTRTMSIHVTCS